LLEQLWDELARSERATSSIASGKIRAHGRRNITIPARSFVMPKTDAAEFLRSRRAWRPPERNSRLEFGGGELIVWPDNGFHF
jgi:hypothetical protein